MSSSAPAQPDFLSNEEPLSEYEPGGYHPTKLGDTLGRRYQIKRKLGWGGYSTVWLAQDKETKDYLSIKILTAFASRSPKLHELEYLQHTAKYDPTHPGYSRIIRLLDHFYHSGPYGSHLCLVTEVMGEGVQSLITFTKFHNQTAIAKDIIRQVLQGVDYIHKSGIVHTDFKLDNFLMEIEDMNAYVKRALDSSSAIVHPPVKAEDGTPITYVTSTPLAISNEDAESFKRLKVKIIDLGIACWESGCRLGLEERHVESRVHSPRYDQDRKSNLSCGYRGYLEQGLCTPSPFWKVPKDLLKRGKYSVKYFKPDGSFVFDFSDKEALIPKWDTLLNDLVGVLHPDELERLKSFLGAMLTVRPEDRPTAEQLLDHEWLRSETLMLP
ncbi:hypothetical protein EW145_g5814 [Phellinidium pouzarii]|uniref:non-specific serine/threonine protein kinase n=1 Tax=Phellinidium pouzarii TaxID=167371 RepID=A0A4V3XC10_9AGAM|nr:hypothetical protein EW145_g5814 [Phellinidium pouzarii]